MLAGIRDILIISTPNDLPHFRRLLDDGSQLGLSIEYAEQDEPRGLAEAFLIGADHIGDDSVALILGDNIFHGYSFSRLLEISVTDVAGCVLFGYSVTEPGHYGVGEVDAAGRLISVEEKPEHPRSNLAITGLYIYDNAVVDIARGLRPSLRGELEITDVNRVYLERGQARLVDLGRGFVWLDAGTSETLLAAGQYVQTIEQRQGVLIACIEEIAMKKGYIDVDECHRLGLENASSSYGRYVMEVAKEFH